MRSQEVLLEKLVDNPYQPRQVIEEEPLQELAESIQSLGVLHPPLVFEQEAESYAIIAGHRRVEACRKLGMKSLPVWVISSKEPSFMAQASLVENLQRADLNPIEVALALSRLQQEFGYTHQTLAQVIGKKRVTVTHFLRLLSLEPSVQEALSKAVLSMGHAKCLAVLSHPKQLQWLKIILRDGLSVHALEKRISKTQKTLKTRAPASSEAELREKLVGRFQLRSQVFVNQEGSGWVKLYFKRPEDLWRLWQESSEKPFEEESFTDDKRTF
jgi:ParB family chromosome partitioning protein